MSNSTGTVSYSATFGFGGNSFPPSVLAEVIEIEGPGFKVTSVDLSNLNSPSHAREFRAGFTDAGEITLKLTFTQSAYITLLSYLNYSLQAWQITLPLVGSQSTAAKVTGYGHISSLGQAIPEDDRITNDVTIKVSGMPSFTGGA